MAHPSITATTVTGQTVSFGDGQGLFVLTTDSQTDNATSGPATATSTYGQISGDMFTFGGGNDDYVQVGNATVTATTDSSDTAIATLTIGDVSAPPDAYFGNTIAGDQIGFGNGNADHVALLFNDTVTATGSLSSFTAIELSLSIANDKISFGSGNGDYVELGGQITSTASAGFQTFRQTHR